MALDAAPETVCWCVHWTVCCRCRAMMLWRCNTPLCLLRPLWTFSQCCSPPCSIEVGVCPPLTAQVTCWDPGAWLHPISRMACVTGVSGFTSLANDWLAGQKLRDNYLRDLLSRVSTPTLPNLHKLLAQYYTTTTPNVSPEPL